MRIPVGGEEEEPPPSSGTDLGGARLVQLTSFFSSGTTDHNR